jgi:hypothetical protein
MTVSAVVVGTGFGCFTHVRALQAADFAVHALVGRDPGRRSSSELSRRISGDDVENSGPAPSQG